MSAPVADPTDLATPPPQGTLSLPSSNGRTRSRDEYDADSDSEPASSPHPPKMPRTDQEDAEEEEVSAPSSDPTILRLIEELECGMCAGLYIDPVALNGCGHTFCGSCVTQWIASIPRFPLALLPGDPVPNPIACPQCRHAPIQTATPSRMAKTMSDLLLQVHPGVARPANEIVQARALYNPSGSKSVLKFPTPPAAPRMQERDYWRPCRWCYSADRGWKCPVPVARFEVPDERPLCVRADGVPPEGHRLCAGCERLSPAHAPTSASCGLCGEGYCGDIQTNCDCGPVSASKPSVQYNALSAMLEDLPSDMLLMAFKDNWTEMYNLGVYVAANPEGNSTPTIYKAIIDWLRSPEGIDSGGVLGLMTRADIGIRLRQGAADEMQQCVMPVEAGAAEENICSNCADELLCSGIFEWWMRQLQKPEVAEKMPANIKGRPNCKFGRKCARQDVDAHSKKYNHICEALPAEEADKLHQDDTMPAGAVGGPNDPAPSRRHRRHRAEADTDSEGDESDGETDTDDEGDQKPNSADAGVQWEAVPTGTILRVEAPPIHAAWKAETPTTATWTSSTTATAPATVATPSQPAVAIAHLIHEVNTAPSSSNSRLLSPNGQHGQVTSARISSSAPSPLNAPPSTVAPHLVFNEVRRTQTPPLGLSQLPNGIGFNAEAGSSELPKLVMPAPKSSPTRFTFDAMMAGDGIGAVGGSRGQGSSMDID